MGNIVDKLKYLNNSVNDIQAAIQEKGIKVEDSDPLGSYGDKIREIQIGVVCMDIEDVTDYVGNGSYEDINIKDYNTLTAHIAFTEQDLICKDVEDITETIIITENNYTNL